MPKPIAYVETTVPNFYHDFRPDAAIVERRLWTREWWASAMERYELVTSETVVEKLSAGTSQFVPLRLELLRNLPLIATTPDVKAAAET